MEALHMILPETWNNISWVVQNSVTQIKDVLLATRRLLEEVKEYSISSKVEYIRERSEDVEKN